MTWPRVTRDTQTLQNFGKDLQNPGNFHRVSVFRTTIWFDGFRGKERERRERDSEVKPREEENFQQFSGSVAI